MFYLRSPFNSATQEIDVPNVHHTVFVDIRRGKVRSSRTGRHVDTEREILNGDPAVAAPGERASIGEAAARYGIAFLTVRRIADKYGMAKMLDFFGRVVHDAEYLNNAARSALGVPWQTVKADCVRYIRSVT